MYSRNAVVPPAGIIVPGERDRFVIGSSYRCDIFYKDGVHIRPEHGRILLGSRKEEARMELCSLQGVLVNRREGERKHFEKQDEGNYVLPLSKGDEVRIFGLWILYYETVLMIGARYGDMRLSVGVREGRNAFAAHRRG